MTSEPTRRLEVDLTVREWELLFHGIASAASHYRHDEHATTAVELDALRSKLHLAKQDADEKARGDRPTP
jgi:hypothetical protein